MLHNFASISRLLRLTAVCILCNQYHHEQLAICNPCLKLFIPLKYACSICRVALPSNFITQCSYCRKQKPTYDQILTAYAFEEPLRTLIHQFKYYKALYLSTLLTKFMLDALPNQTYRPDCFIPIPLHSKRLYNRGFNQSVVLAKLLSKYLNVPIDLTLVHKIINTPPQATLSRKQRQQNLNASFIAKSNRYQHVTIIDDLITTGNTANEVAKLLKKQHVQRVDVWCIARASIDSI